MDAIRLGSICRALRVHKGWRQEDVANRVELSRTTVSFLENGHISRLRVDAVIRIFEAPGGRIDFVARWQGGELDRLLNARHSALHESVARTFRRLSEWIIVPEVSFAIRGERGVIDILAWHPPTRTLLVIELKTEIVDINELMGTVDKKRRLAATVARERGWFPTTVAVWLIVADSVINRRRVRSHTTTLRASFPTDGRSVTGWLRHPSRELRCLSFWSNAQGTNTKSGFATVRRVRARRCMAA